MKQPRRLPGLRDLRDSDEPDVIRKLVESFAADTTSRLLRLHEAAARGDIKTIANEAHTVKRTAAALGEELLRAHAELLVREAK